MSPKSVRKQSTGLPLTNVVIVVVFACLSARCAEAAPSAMKIAANGKPLQQITALRQAKLYQRARRTAQRLLARRPHDAEAHLAMAEVLRDMGQTSEAIKEYTRAFHLKPNMVEALVPLSELRLRSADRELGLSYARMAVLAAPKSDQVRETLIKALIATNRLEEAEKELAPKLKGASASPDTLVLASE